jgi:hypothetical protein
MREDPMPDYGDILRTMANTPPLNNAERQLHASLLELLAQCLRADELDIVIDQAAVSEHFPERSMALRMR